MIKLIYIQSCTFRHFKKNIVSWRICLKRHSATSFWGNSLPNTTLVNNHKNKKNIEVKKWFLIPIQTGRGWANFQQFPKNGLLRSSIFLEMVENWLIKCQGLNKNVPNIQVGWPTPTPSTSLTIKVVYLVSESWYG